MGEQNNSTQLSIFDFDYSHENSGNRSLSGEMMVGGLGSVKERDADVDVVIAKVRQEIVAKAKAESVRVDEFTVISYATQVVAGTNYFVKIRLNKDDGGHVHVRVYEKLPCYGAEVSLDAMVPGKKHDDPLEHF